MAQTVQAPTASRHNPAGCRGASSWRLFDGETTKGRDRWSVVFRWVYLIVEVVEGSSRSETRERTTET